ncbi:MAG: AraC family transcriptional regulator [Clostridia bacterium]|nr:AraC family transcriptional regulator [Clostridia bacterium]
MSIKYEERKEQISLFKNKVKACPAHLHKEIELIYVVKGTVHACCDTKDYILEEGDLFFSFPNQVHYFNDFPNNDSIGYIMIISTEILKDYSSFLLKKIPIDSVIKHDPSKKEIRELITKIFEIKQSSKRYKDEICKAYLNVLFGFILDGLKVQNADNKNKDMLSVILSYCVQNYKEEITLDSIAKEQHVSKYYISRLFSEKIKINFNSYINMLRINEAMERLVKSDETITQIGNSVGYNTIRTFNRAFLAQTGMQPREYRSRYKKTKS